MKKLNPLAALSLCLFLAACSTTSKTRVITYDNSGKAVSVSTTSSTTNESVEAIASAGGAVKDGVVTGYEWTKDKTVKGYNWVKDKVTDAQPGQTVAQPAPETDSGAAPSVQPLTQ